MPRHPARARPEAGSANQAPASQWRHQKALAGGGALPDVGIYCLNAARYLSGEEPVAVWGTQYSTPGDARFKEVEENFLFTLRFPSGLLAHCTTGYGHHESRRMRLMGSEGWLDMDPAFSYGGLRLLMARKSQEDARAEDTVGAQAAGAQPVRAGDRPLLRVCPRGPRAPHSW
ncbi:hypothetical protein F0U59_02860 [Archangium gephyra]|nr:hypothetical protein F0U59_02860 [Archangium gephyra]